VKSREIWAATVSGIRAKALLSQFLERRVNRRERKNASRISQILEREARI